MNQEPVSPVVVEEVAMTDRWSTMEEIISGYSDGNVDVLLGSQTFFSGLEAAYTSGEISAADLDRILDAVVFSAVKHKSQTRKNSKMTPYIIHPIGVANDLLTIGQVRDAEILIGALLHDTVEDTETTFEEIRAAFGEKVEGYVKEVTDDKSLPKMERKRLQIEHAPEKSVGAAQIKLADKLYNLTDLFQDAPADWSEERVLEYFQWAEKVVGGLPPANPALKEAVDGVIASYWKSQE